MKKKKLLIATIALATITSTYAAQSKSYHEYSKTIEQTSSFNAHAEEIPVSLFDVPATNTKKNMFSERAKTNVPHISESVAIDNSHDFTVNSNTHQRDPHRSVRTWLYAF